MLWNEGNEFLEVVWLAGRFALERAARGGTLLPHPKPRSAAGGGRAPEELPVCEAQHQS